MDLIASTQALLQAAGYGTRVQPVAGTRVLQFEDEALMGFACEFSTSDELLEGWRPMETRLLEHHAGILRSAREKAWNVYCVFLTVEAAEENTARRVRWIEENLERTRKLTGCGASSREALQHILLPLLPLQHQAAVTPEDTTQRLLRRIKGIAPAIADIALAERVPAAEVIRQLRESL